MKRAFSILACLLLTGCEQWKKLTGTGNTPVNQSLTPANILIIGQSNALRMSTRASEDGRISGDAGIAAAFAPRPVKIFNCAVGGTYIREWASGQPNFNACVQLAQRQHIDGIFWYQGEQDALADGDYTAWAQDFTTLMRSFRNWLGYDAPIVYAQLSASSNPLYIHWKEVQDEQASVSINKAAMMRTIDIKPGPLAYDGTHYSPEGYYQLGLRFVATLKQINMEAAQ